MRTAQRPAGSKIETKSGTLLPCKESDRPNLIFHPDISLNPRPKAYRMQNGRRDENSEKEEIKK